MKPLERLLFAQGGRCFFCDQPLLLAEASVEHLFASANGGPNNDQNCVVCCQALNSLLGSMSLKEKFKVVLNQRSKFKCPNGAACPDVPEPIANSPVPVTIDFIIANLKQREQSKPRTLKALSGVVKSLLPKGSADSAINALVQELQSTGKISIEGGKLAYRL